MVVAKIIRGEEIRRVNLSLDITFEDLTQLIRSLMILEEGALTLRYEDDEKDWVLVSSTPELQEAFRISSSLNKILRLDVSIKKESPCHKKEFCTRRRPEDSPRRCPFFNPHEAKSNGPNHLATCDGCFQRIAGIRFKCNTCPNFDFCEKCRDSTQNHPAEHKFTKIEDPRTFVHQAICDNCNNWILGSRYKCTQCPDYDLCIDCKSKEGVHDHPFMEVPVPWRRHCGRDRRGCHGPRRPVRVEVRQDVPKEETKEDVKEIPVEVKEELKEEVKEVKEEVKELKEEVKEVKEEEKTVKEDDNAEVDHPLKKALKQLEDMGFNDRTKSIPLLIKNNLDIVATIQQLLEI